MNTKNKQSGFGLVEIAVIVIILALAGFMGWRLYGNHSTPVRVDSSSERKSENTTEEADKEDYSSTSNVDITELGISLNVPEELKTLEYKYAINNRGDEVVALTTKEMAKYCSLDGPDSPLGVMFKIDGQYEKREGPQPELIRQYDDFFIAYREPQQNCSPTNSHEVIDLQKRQVSILKETFSEIEFIN